MTFEDKDLSWQEFIYDKIFLRQKMPEISLPKIFMKKIFMIAISFTNYYNKNFHDATFMIKFHDRKISWWIFFMKKNFLTKSFFNKVFWYNNIYDKKIHDKIFMTVNLIIYFNKNIFDNFFKYFTNTNFFFIQIWIPNIQVGHTAQNKGVPHFLHFFAIRLAQIW